MSDPGFIVTVPSEPPDLDAFRELNERKAPWEERVKEIHKQFPSTAKLSWKRVFDQDPALLGRMINDILKIDAAEPGKPGKRPAIEPQEAATRLRQITGEDFATVAFDKAFQALTHGKSIRAIAAKTGLNRNYVYYLQQGGTPSAPAMEQIARAYKKDPGYFVEYRVAYLFAHLHFKLQDVPEASVFFYRKLQAARGA